MSFLSGAKQKVESFLNKREYRQSTLYDFSLVTRAVIYVYEYSNLIASSVPGSSGLTQLAKLPVQINPSDYRRMKFNEGTSISSPNNKMDWKGIAAGFKKSEKNSLDLNLTFDISDEYMAISNNGLIAYDVDIDSATIINDLYKYSNPGYLCLFKWGPLNYLSRISSIDCTYEKFSPYGEPLRAKVTINFEKLELNGSTIYSDADPSGVIGGTNWSTVKKNQKTDSAMVVAQKLSEAAANEALPAIISAART